jgi:hypothetical protein
MSTAVFRSGGARIGYTRITHISTVSQNLVQQYAAPETACVTRTFSDTMSGAGERTGFGWEVTNSSLALPAGQSPNRLNFTVLERPSIGS